MSSGGGFRQQVPRLSPVSYGVLCMGSTKDSRETIVAVRSALSSPRLQTFERATVFLGEESSPGLELYAWNARVSAALLVPLHVCEVVVRNAVSDVLEAMYGPRWPWSAGFERSLPVSNRGYCPRMDIQKSRQYATSAGKVIPELKFVFWQRLFTSRYDLRLWDGHLRRVLPGLDPSTPVGQLRQRIYEDIEQIRGLRNRIAHHEPIFKRDLSDDFSKMMRLVEARCKVTTAWMMRNQTATEVLGERGSM